jgi:hypothetical protein
MTRIVFVSLVLAALALGQKSKEPEYKVVSTARPNDIAQKLNEQSAQGWTYMTTQSMNQVAARYTI